jgi:hypothetical protein
MLVELRVVYSVPHNLDSGIRSKVYEKWTKKSVSTNT